MSFVQAQVNERMERVPFAPGALMDDGLVDIVLVTDASGPAIASQALAQYMDGAHVQLPFVEVVRRQSFRVTPAAGGRDEARDVNLDGELVASAAPFSAACLRRELEVIAS